MLRPEDLSFPGKLQLSVLWEGGCSDGAGLELAHGRQTEDAPTDSGAGLERQRVAIA